MPTKPQALSVRSPVNAAGNAMKFNDRDYDVLELYRAAGDAGVEFKDVQAKFPDEPMTDRVGLMVNTGLLEEMEEENGEPLPNRFCINEWGIKALDQRGKKSIKNVQASAAAQAAKPKGRGARVTEED